MHARITFAKARPDARDEAARIWSESVLPTVKQQKGNQGADLCFCEDPVDEAIAITLWESKEDADAGVASGQYQENVQKFAQLFTSPPELKSYEVVSWGAR